MEQLMELLEQLQKRYPNELPRNTKMSIEDMRVLQGQQIVIDYIINYISLLTEPKK